MAELSVNDALKLAAKNHAEGKLQEAEFLYRKILEVNPNNADALHLLGVIAHQTGKHEDAVRDIGKAIQLNPNVAFYYGNLGMAYDALEKEEESAKNFIKALEIDPKYNKAYLAHYNLGIFYMDRKKINEAIEHYDKAIELNKNFFEAYWNRGIALLLLGRFKEGFEGYEYRFKKENPTDSRVFDKPKWDGSSLNGKRILILAEQGFGDNINFARYAQLVKDKGGHIILECKKELIRLFENLSGIDEFAIKGKNVSDIKFDFYIHLMSLPGIFNTNLDNVPNKSAYLEADSKLVQKFKTKLKNDKFKIGIVWAGNPKQENDKNRSTGFEKFKILKGISKIELVSLQVGEALRQLNDKSVIDMSNEITDFADTAAIIANLDLVISVDTSVAHLAGAMGKPVWMLLSYVHDWRWLLDRKDSPWYPSMRLFRQPKLGDWDFVFNDVCNELRNLLTS